MKRTKKVLSCYIVGALALGMIPGCAAQKQATDSSSQSIQDVTITFERQKDATKGTAASISAFEKKYPHIKVNLLSMPSSSDSLHNALVTALAADDSSFDVMNMDTCWTQEFLEAGWVSPVDDVFTKSEQSKFMPGPLSNVTYNGKVYAYPYFMDCGVLFYRKDIITTPPKTWEELIKMSKDNIGKNGIKYGYVLQGSQYEGFVCNALEFINGNGGAVLTKGKVTVNTPQVIQGLQYMKTILSSGITPAGVNTYKEADCTQLFIQGGTLFMRNWPKQMSIVNGDSSKVKGKVGICQLPSGKDGKSGAGTLGGYNIGINKNSTHKSQALTFVQYMTGEEGQKINALNGSQLPTRKDLYEDKDVLAVNTYWKGLYSVFMNATPRPLSAKYSKISDSMQINFNKAVNGMIPITTAVKSVESDMNTILNTK